ncbi:hypothetical protein TREMEDRAFT_59874 [Tremella mesenterica DSM 1558]|uniref:uncharacterized protein n=1 Tax=Tremella mesenterica (strain ATCC 24925 / CBS 8224 / DSM 1558 / NBRC 9311 / NRRL Y-6157 / RJB 2259-6 / UBC 559-6) TaxID=578456 RepID=UPI0003F4A0D6|nr:uncharacterized protein TREMEDRAFT_59874 [Tremella mesenterica DSM 1558]EIW73701.1 hypothetical protein TREMEDRAFT_59874 [Tremella mesenterica DSM 1558]
MQPVSNSIVRMASSFFQEERSQRAEVGSTSLSPQSPLASYTQSLRLLEPNRLYPKRPIEKTKLFPTSRHKHYGIHKGLQTVHTCMSPLSPLASPSPSSSPYMKTSTSTPKLERYKQKATTIPFPSTFLPNQQQHHTSFTESYRVINPNISPMRHHPTRDENAQYNITRTRTGKDHIPQRMTYDSKGHVSAKPRKHVVRFSEKNLVQETSRFCPVTYAPLILRAFDARKKGVRGMIYFCTSLNLRVYVNKIPTA